MSKIAKMRDSRKWS